MDTYYLVPENMIDKAHMKFIREDPQMIKKNGVTVFGRIEVMSRLFEMPKEFTVINQMNENGPVAEAGMGIQNRSRKKQKH